MRIALITKTRTLATLRSLTTCLLAVTLLVPALEVPANAAPQVSDEFRRVAKALAKRVASDQLKTICKDKTGSDLDVCEAITDSAGATFAMAIDGRVDEEALTEALVELASRLTQAAATDAARQLIETILADLSRETGNRCQVVIEADGGKPVPVKPEEIATEISTCLITDVLGSSPKTCKDIKKRVEALRVECKSAKGPEVKDYKARVAITQLRALLSGSTPSDFYGAVAKAVERYESFFSGIDSPNDQSVFDAETIDAVLAPGPRDAECPKLAETRKRLTTWQGERNAVFLELSRALAAFRPLPSDALAKVPVDLPDPGCPTGHPLAEKTATLQHVANTYRTDLKLVATLDPLVLPAFLGALLVDYARDHNESKLRKHLEDFALRALARAIAAGDKNGRVCTMTDPAPTPPTATCAALVPGPATLTITLPNGLVPDSPEYDRHVDEIQAVVEDRFSPESARRTCEYQAVASALGRTIQVGPQGLCRKLVVPSSFDILAAAGPFASLLASASGVASTTGYAQWLPAKRVHAGNEIVRLALPAQLVASDGYSNLLLVLRGIASHLAEHPEFGSILEVLDDALEPLLEDGKFDFSRVVLAEGAKRIRPVVDPFLDTRLAPISCAEGDEASSLRCGVRVLIGAVYDPLLDYVIIENPTDADRRRLATKAYTKALELDPLSRTPVLFNVGLGATGLVPFDESATVHLTLLDKFGLAHRFGDRNEWEVGGFVGGFLDAIIRTAADSKEEQYWLAGGTFGRRQIASSLPFGVGLHAGVALPFDLTETGDRIALAGGLVLTVPADIAFGD